MTTDQIVGMREDWEPAHEIEHFEVCRECGQAIDLRELDQLLHHAKPGHEPRTLNG